MQQTAANCELKARMSLLGVTAKGLARAAGVAPSTVYRYLDGGDARLSTLAKMDRALRQREAELRRALDVRSDAA